MVYINGKRNGYDEAQTGETMTVSELIEFLSQYKDEEKVYLINDGGYTYGNITDYDISTDKNDLGYRY